MLVLNFLEFSSENLIKEYKMFLMFVNPVLNSIKLSVNVLLSYLLVNKFDFNNWLRKISFVKMFNNYHYIPWN